MKLARSPLSAALTLTTTWLLLSGCAQVHSGSAQRDPGFEPGAVHPELLDTGSYRTKPADPLGKAGDPLVAVALEGHRLAENVVFPFQIDNTLLTVAGNSTGVMRDPGVVASLLQRDALMSAVASHNYVTGYAAASSDTGPPDFDQTHYLQNSVLIFRTDADATAAATSMAQATKTPGDDVYAHTVPTASPLSLPGHPETLAPTWTQYYQSLNRTVHTVTAFTPHSRYVLVQRAISEESHVNAIDLVTRALERQLAQIDSFSPTPFDQLTSLPRDPSGLIARMLLPDEGNRTPQNGTYGPHAALVLQPSLLANPSLVDDLGIDLVIEEDGLLTRAKDAASAQTFLGSLAAVRTDLGWRKIDGIPGLTAAQCLKKPAASQFSSDLFWCAVPHDTLVLENSSSQESEAKQKLAAGYLMLDTK